MTVEDFLVNKEKYDLPKNLDTPQKRLAFLEKKSGLHLGNKINRQILTELVAIGQETDAELFYKALQTFDHYKVPGLQHGPQWPPLKPQFNFQWLRLNFPNSCFSYSGICKDPPKEETSSLSLSHPGILSLGLFLAMPWLGLSSVSAAFAIDSTGHPDKAERFVKENFLGEVYEDPPPGSPPMD